jgi:crotonobetainyl-CoA:carnitine CoA-transferase CaiB-like acyl-CoA transferase
MPEGLLEGVRVVDLAGEPAAMTGRVLADLGADVVKVELPGGDPLRAEPHRFAAWNANKHGLVVRGAADPALSELLDAAHVVIDTPGFPGALEVDVALAPGAVWVSVTPFGLTGPRAWWRASDLGVMAASGNMYCTGDPDRAPVRCTEPSGYAHVGGEAAFAALTGLASGRPQRIDVSMQEVVFVANMARPASFPKTGFRGSRRGANIGRTREIWPTLDGFVSFGLRGGKARVPSLETLTKLVAAEEGLDATALNGRDWSAFSPNTTSDEELAAIEAPVESFFARHTMSELYDIACETNLMLAPANSPREILGSAQLAAREFFGPLGDAGRFPRSFVVVRSADGEAAPARPSSPAPVLRATPRAGDPAGLVRSDATEGARLHQGSGGSGGAWAGTNILEFGSGAAGPIATRYFVEHGATVLRIESRSRPDFLRVYALTPKNPHGLEGAPMFDGLNVGKLDARFNLKHPTGIELVRRLVVEWADAVAENFAPRAMRGFGLDYDSLVPHKPDLVMVSACLNGQTGPHRNYPGFGGQGSALSGFNWLTGWPDREPVGPHGTITDSLAPRFVAAALAAGLLYRSRTGRGVYLDVSQVEAAVWALTPWLLDYELDGLTRARDGNRSARAVPHGAFPCADEGDVGDRWIAIATWTDDEWATLAALIGLTGRWLTLDERRENVDDVEAAVAAWTGSRTRGQIAQTLQAVGIEAVPVNDFGDIHTDPQVAARAHFVALTHPFMGDGLYERNGFRLSNAPSGYGRSGPTLGQDNDFVLGELLGLSRDEQRRLAQEGVLD